MNGQMLTSEKFTSDAGARLISVRTSDTLRPFIASGTPGVDEWEDYILLVDSRALDRECLSKSLSEYDDAMHIVTVGSLDEWQMRNMQVLPSAVLFMIGGRKVSDTDISAKICALVERFQPSPVIVGADGDELAQLLHALECGARGYIPTSVGIRVAAEAVALARAGGVFVPASSLLAAKEAIAPVASRNDCLDSLFTPREVVVAEALRRGKANKIIAYEMDLCESTVKVHIRNIMKKLNATNRTEVAYKIRELVR
ncbi:MULTISPECIES: response regulator transcription factor [unclassified Rhizobium]|uniref:response regulator transcription factor n=1 Tax=unclassified Rhizobium TaxID=2613769 RepID=UPI000DDDE993|nr:MULTISPECIES: response regulator transcription factor [unclassified Rhizobium]MBB3287024.1 DNA-binding NarL/FixJ family response regulator [Rhizobium sp. BK252]MBB3401764.1 DNA-binding NarL/FixJ family response regulator [Rhizobium sp. BK289]MBB3414292.1 DNA-binding NarL/FixJ family response regulator [Rhizobium sp. BK284]MBB3482179.1 DNA-binding NarL/FixJ family response regulator [Rhizobium sp. BK347]MDK4718519.1 response regulator transcription factor [Rhizobium sp. CNPSo 3968]